MKTGEPKPATVIPRDTSEVILVVRSNIKPIRFKTNHGKILAVEDDPSSDDLWLHIAPGTHLITFSAECYQSIEKRIYIAQEQKSKLIEIEKDLAYFLYVKRTDQQPPRIGHTPPPKATEGDTIVWDAVVTDNFCASEVKLFYRRKGETAYQFARMKKLKNSDNFQAKLVAQAPGIEYYLEAWDVFGNGPKLWKSDDEPQLIKVKSQAQKKCQTALLEAEQNYKDGRFNQAIALVKDCLNQRGPALEEKKTAYRLLALCYNASNDLEKAKNYVWKLLNLDPDYEPAPHDPLSFINLFKEVKQQQGQALKAPPWASQQPNAKGPQPRRTLPERLFSWVFFDLYYQLLGFSSTFWKQQFGETPFENYHEGVGGNFGIGNPIFRLGAGSHNMLHRNWANKAPQFSGAGYQIHALLGIPYKRLVRIEFGLGYYWMDYKLTDRANKIVSLRNNGAFVILTPSLGTTNVKLFGEADLAIKPNGTLPFLYFRTGLRFAYPVKSDLKR